MISVWDKHFNLANSILVSLALTIKDLIAKGILAEDDGQSRNTGYILA